jgi:nucleoid DNA-binding protein
VTVKISYADFLDLLTQKSGASRNRADQFMRTLINILRAGLDRDGHVTVRGLGRFELRWQNERMGRNPQTGETIEIAAHYKIHFRPDATLRRFFNRKYANLKLKYLSQGQTRQSVNIRPIEDAQVKPAHDLKSEVHETHHPPDPKRPTESIGKKETEKPYSYKWAWIVIPVLIVILIFLLIIRKEPVHPASEKKQAKEINPIEIVQSEEKPAAPAFAGATHRVKSGDQLWGLAGEYYHCQYLWPYIFGENDTLLKNPDVLHTAAELAIPPLMGKQNELTATDRERIAEGYIKTYLAYKKAGRQDAHTYLWTAGQLGGEEIIRKYISLIDAADLNRIRRIKGQCRI